MINLVSFCCCILWSLTLPTITWNGISFYFRIVCLRDHCSLFFNTTHLAKAESLIVHLDLVLNLLNEGNSIIWSGVLLHNRHANLCKPQGVHLGLKVGDEVGVDGDQLGLHARLFHQAVQLDGQLGKNKGWAASTTKLCESTPGARASCCTTPRISPTLTPPEKRSCDAGF